jgi:hypothetical protein
MSRTLKRSIPSPTDWLSLPVAQDLIRQAVEAPADRRTQAVRILNLLLDAQGAEVPLPIVMRCAAQYNYCIHILRRAGFRILNRSEKCNGILHSWYRLEISGLDDSTPPAPEPRARRVKRPAENLQLFTQEQTQPTPPAPPAPAKPAQSQTIWRDPEMGGLARG